MKKTKTILFTMGVFVSIVLTVTYFAGGNLDDEISSYNGVDKAVIIDQLHKDIPSLYFQNKAQTLLENAGYQVDLFTTEDITVDFYKKLPTMNYKFIVFRTHSVAFGTVENSASLLTGEIYNIESHIDGQLSGQLKKAVPFLADHVREVGWAALANQTYFTIGSKAVNEMMQGNFDKSIVILGGCDTLSGNNLADSFLKRGASVVIGWDGLISSSDNDRTILELLEKILSDGEDISNAVESTKENFVSRTQYSPTLKYFLNNDGASNDF